MAGLDTHRAGFRWVPGRDNEDELLLSQGESENSLVMSWLLNSMQPAIARGYLFFDTACKIWSAAAQTYSKVGNDALVYEIRKKKLHETKQGDMTIAQYFSELSSLWQELDYYQDFNAECPSDATKFQKLMEKERVYDFLAGLQAEYDPIRVQVLGRDPFPSLCQTYAFVQQKESRNVMLHQIVPEISALISNTTLKSIKGPQHRASDQGVLDKDLIKYDYCGRTRHTRETC
uniref:Uncharacterized protein n=1 Tax=Ananas comosus var. bracteatus TaxID=296719 RepID=A0A6V7NWA1_ANACO|nr:unnamed protein product [Ananas comosus var. bracteatus]